MPNSSPPAAPETFPSQPTTAATTKPATEIPVREARLILLWPLTLHLTSPARDAEAMAKAVEKVGDELRRRGRSGTTRWDHEPDPLRHVLPESDSVEDTARWKNAAYAETLYFHEFVQSFLFRKQPGGGRDAPFRLFRRNDVKFVQTTLAGSRSAKLDVKRLNLYLFRTGVAILTLELWTLREADGTSGWKLAQFQDFHDYFRRVYAPFFVLSENPDGKNGVVREVGHLVPQAVAWLDKSNTILCRRTRTGDCETGAWTRADALGDVEALIDGPDERDGRRRPPVFRHWRFLLDDALLLAGQDGGRDEPRWHQGVDERMPSLATVSLTPVAGGKPDWRPEHALTHYDSVRDGDLMRLCFADDQGPSAFPYDADFLARTFWTDNAYSRFKDRGTLFLFSGYAFVAVGAGWSFDNHVMEHVRRHYFQMGLLAHFELASLLAFSSQISRAVRRLDNDSDHHAFEAEMQAIEEQFLQFVHRFRFTGVSNQIQAREMFDLWRKRLQLDELFTDVQTEIHTANAFLASRTQSRTSTAATKLTQVATVGVVLGLAFSALGMNVIFTEGLVGKELNEATVRLHLAIAGGTIGVFLLAGRLLVRYLRKREATGSIKEPLDTILLGSGIFALVMAAGAMFVR